MPANFLSFGDHVLKFFIQKSVWDLLNAKLISQAAVNTDTTSLASYRLKIDD